MTNQTRLQELRTMPYQAYLQTPEWQAKREQALERATHRCQLCDSPDSLNAHHRTYERRGDEEPADLTVLCKACHSLFHDRVPTEEQEHTFHHLSHILQEFTIRADANEPSGIVTGYKDLDRLLGGGLQKSDLILLGGRPSFGKTSLALNIALKTAEAGNSVAIFSLEMDREQLLNRMLAANSAIDLVRMRNQHLDDKEWERVLYSMGILAELSIWISDKVATVDSMRHQIHQLVAASEKPDLIIVDYIGLIEPDKYTKRQSSEQQIRAISRGLKLLAREFNVPVLALCQLSREADRRQGKRPQLSDLRDSGSQEQDADVVLLVHREDAYDPHTNRINIADIIVAKHRNGPLGEVPLYFSEKYTSFMDLEVTPPDPGN